MRERGVFRAKCSSNADSLRIPRGGADVTTPCAAILVEGTVLGSERYGQSAEPLFERPGVAAAANDHAVRGIRSQRTEQFAEPVRGYGLFGTGTDRSERTVVIEQQQPSFRTTVWPDDLGRDGFGRQPFAAYRFVAAADVGQAPS